MPDGRTLTVTLPDDLADLVRRRVEAGDYESESAMVREGLEALLGRDRSLDDWLRTEVRAGHEDYLRDPGSALTGEDLLRRLSGRSRPS
jgi:antitoxin ParD1/3/4